MRLNNPVTYTGEVRPGGPADRRELAHMRIGKLAVDPKMSNNAYLLTCRATNQQVLIDAADEGTEILSQVQDVQAVITTHKHRSAI